MQQQKVISDRFATQTVLEQLSPLTRAALQFCSLSFLSLSSGNVFLINCANSDAMRLLECPQLVEIAWVLQKTFGNTCICLYQAQKHLIMRFNGEQLSRGFPKRLS
jgi:hypothetical protein